MSDRTSKRNRVDLLARERDFSRGWIAEKNGEPARSNESNDMADGRAAFRYALANGRDPRWTIRIGERRHNDAER